MFSLFVSSVKKYVEFQGNATRKEYWTFVLFLYLAAILGGIMDGLLGTGFIGNAAIVVLFLPYISCFVRRMHDVGKSGWFMIIPIYNLVLALTPSVKEETRS